MNPSTIVTAFHSLSTTKTTDSTVWKTLLNRSDDRPDIVTIEKGTILYVARDKRILSDDNVVTAALSMNYFLYTEQPIPEHVPKHISNGRKYKKIGEWRFYSNRYYSKVVLDRDVTLVDTRGHIAEEYLLIKDRLLGTDGLLISKSSNPNLISIQIENILDICTAVKRIRPLSKTLYSAAKNMTYGDHDLLKLESVIIDRRPFE